ncbi:CRT10-domain-containing protein [Suhomyces tanzawaensis NRRL Y-17324]|uniref:CRT10-domain-containing protein n=1 Tax=Suhomyces tanzawaensis NRRL Y-17324 TaxID=984487 RepID=A0A1E4SDT8_9ASCO|nr:CRT10-domain-containing protein [Suhomyces tanzawaensis NRRL Y-17324]ODV77665.1 CRT10-domain-containing protein [Suhomyces tanzawaensis NRRL Y-17324]
MKWDLYDPVTRREIEGNRGIYDNYNPELGCVEVNDPSKMVRMSPGEIYRDLTELKHLKINKLSLEGVKRYKNNISTVITDSENEDFLVVACNSELVLFDFDKTTLMPNTRPVLRFDTRPASTSTSDRLVSTWPQFPHTINFLKFNDNFTGRPVLGACVDDGSLLIWYTETIINFIKRFNLTKRSHVQDGGDLYQDNNRFFGLKINPDFKVKMESSLWGLDFLSYKDSMGSTHNLIAASDNSQMVTFIYYDTSSEEYYHVKTHQVLHNIPEVSFISHEIKNNTHEVKISCASISAELIIFRFRFQIIEGPLNINEANHFTRKATYYIDPAMAQLEPSELELLDRLDRERFYRVFFVTPPVISRTLLEEDCWTAKPIHSKFFHEVQSLSAVFGDPTINETDEIEHIYNESVLLDLVFDPVKTSHLGIAAGWQFFESRITSLAEPSQLHEAISEPAKLTGVDDEYRRVNKGLSRVYKRLEHRKEETSMNSELYSLREKYDLQAKMFLAVSTTRKLGLFQADTLFCNAATKRVFDLPIPHDESKFTNRISITHIIPELSSFIAVTQQGLVTIMRLCCHRGVYGMRQEHLFPNAISLALGHNGFRSIAGICIRDRSPSQELPRFLLYITYTDGLVIGFELTKRREDELIKVTF